MAVDHHPRQSDGTSSSNVAIVAIAVILLLAVIAFFTLFRPGSDIAEQPAEPEIEFEIEPPAENPPDPGNGGEGEGGASGRI